MTPDRPRSTVRSIQILRAFAALAVVHFHLVEEGVLRGGVCTGAWGVDVFFVISGFIIGLVASRSRHAFLRRRAIRVIPLYWLATTVMIIVALASPVPLNSTEVTLGGAIRSYLFIPYSMPERMGPILGVGWTLDYEVFFYVVVALAMLALRRALRGLLTAAGLIAALALSGFLAPATSFPLAFYQSDLLLEFVMGLLLSLLHQRLAARARVGRGAGESGHVWLSEVGIVLLLVGVGLLVAHDLPAWHALTDPDALPRSLAVGVPALMTVAGALCMEGALPGGALTDALVEIGDASYAIYLFHSFVIVAVSRLLLVGLLAHASGVVRLGVALGVVVLVVLIGVAINRWVDAPVQRWLRRALV